MPSPESLVPDSLSQIQPRPEDLTLGNFPVTAEDQRQTPAVPVEQMHYLLTYASGQKAATYILGETLAEKDLKVRQKEVEVEVLEEMTLTDHLTGIGNRRKLERAYHGLVTEHPLRRSIEPTPAFAATHTAVMVDLDNFRYVNNTYGHAAGDMVLKAVADTVRTSIRERDILGRYGGDELAIILARTEVEEGLIVAQSIQTRLDALRIGEHKLKMTGSIGVAELQHAESLEEGLRLADDAAYAAKEAGRNRVVQWDPSLAPKQG